MFQAVWRNRFSGCGPRFCDERFQSWRKPDKGFYYLTGSTSICFRRVAGHRLPIEREEVAVPSMSPVQNSELFVNLPGHGFWLFGQSHSLGRM
jgi:hypothetical protein